MDHSGGSISFFDRKTRMRWIKGPARSYIHRLLGFIRATALRLGGRPTQNLVKGGLVSCCSPSSQLPSNPPGYASWPTRNTHTSDGMPGGVWEPQCLYAMEPQCKSLCPGAAGDQLPSHADTSPPGMTALGKIPRCHDPPCRVSPLVLGDLRAGPVPRDRFGQPPTCPEMAHGNPIGQMTPTQTHVWFPFQRTTLNPPPPPNPTPYAVQVSQANHCRRI